MEDVREIVIGARPDKPALIIRPANAWRVVGVEVDKREAIWKSLAALQGLPDVLIAVQVHSSKLMEVVIHGDLVPTMDGSGFRAFAIGNNGIVENAKLLSPDHLTALVDGAVLWRFASIVVAQKHLADISRLLANIEKGVSAIADFLRDEQGAKIEAALSYLKSAEAALEDGGRSSAIRIKLHDIGLDMDGIQRHVEKSFSRRLGEQIKDEDWIGYDSLSSGLQRKLNGLSDLLKTHRLATLTRIAALRLLASYQEEGAWKKCQSVAIAESVGRYKEMGERLEGALTTQVDGWSGTGEAFRDAVIEGAKQPLKILERVLSGKPVFDDTDEFGRTPELDCAKADAKAKVNALAKEERNIGNKLEKACSSTERIMLEPAEPVRFLVEWEQNAPLSVRRLSS